MRQALIVVVLAGAAGSFTGAAQSNGENIRGGRLEYRAQVQRDDQSRTVNSVRTVAQALFQGYPVWRVVDVVMQPGDVSSDTFEVDGRTLLPVRRVAVGTASLTLRYGPAGVAGEMRVGAQKVPVLKETGDPGRAGRPLVGDGPGFDLYVAGLPLREGYQTVLRPFGGLQQDTREMRLAVTGRRKVTTAAGTFDVYVVDVAPSDGREGRRGTLDVLTTAPHYLVRSTARTPPMRAGMPGSTLITELTKLELDRGG